MTCKVYKSASAKMLENIGCLRFVEDKIKPKTCKLLVNSSETRIPSLVL